MINETVNDKVKLRTGRLRRYFPENKTFSQGSYPMLSNHGFNFIIFSTCYSILHVPDYDK